jgi:hypothetical protein
MNSRIARAKLRYQNALAALTTAVKTSYPVGTVIDVTIGHARIRAEVIAHRSWSDPRVFVRNIETGATRKFTATDERCKVVVISK